MKPVLTCSFELEQNYSGPSCGLDEAGRGPLAGPVVAACVYVPPEIREKAFWAEVNDSKKLSDKKKDKLFDLIREYCAYGIAEASVEEIDTMNILRASLLAMKRSYELMSANFGITNAMALVDGNQKPPLTCTVQTVIKGDSISRSIAAASILAKVTRDRGMSKLCRQYPMYGWSINAGYGTVLHLAALKEHGVTIHHRRSFAPVEAIISSQIKSNQT